MKILWKIFLVIFITAITVGIGCGGGAIIYSILFPCKGSYCFDALGAGMWTAIFFGICGFIWSIKNFQTLGELKKNPTQITGGISGANINSAKEDLKKTLDTVDIADIISVTFMPHKQDPFTIKTANIKRLSVYITKKLGKYIFEPEELRKTYDYVLDNIEFYISARDFQIIALKIYDFVKVGGEVKINRGK